MTPEIFMGKRNYLLKEFIGGVCFLAEEKNADFALLILSKVS